jgi:hypothetical protein
MLSFEVRWFNEIEVAVAAVSITAKKASDGVYGIGETRLSGLLSHVWTIGCILARYQ